jgi:alpha-1,2-mannosyltransferase
MVPRLSRDLAGVSGIPLGLLMMLAVYVFALRRALQDGATIGARSIAQA